MKVFAEFFRGFRAIEVDLNKLVFLVGDNSSGKSSILHLVDSVLRGGLNAPPALNEELGVGEYDYFSPYFASADVTFGFSTGSGEDFFCKVVTVKNRKDRPPEIIRCSYLTNRTLITCKKTPTAGQARIIRDVDEVDFHRIIDLHKEKMGFNISGKPPRGISFGEPTIIFSLIPYDRLKDGNTFLDRIFGVDISGARLISPIRALPEKFYSASRKITALGLHFAPMWHDFSGVKSKFNFDAVRAFGLESGLFEDIKVKKISAKVPDSPLIVSVIKSNKEFFLNQVGVGVSQVVPILVETVYALRNKPKLAILVQQPELHLHPVAQAALGSFFHRSYSDGLRGILETHSSFLIDRFRSDLRDQNGLKSDAEELASPKDLLILFCVNGPDGNTAYEVDIEHDGALSGEPDAFHTFFVDEMLRTMM